MQVPTTHCTTTNLPASLIQQIYILCSTAISTTSRQGPKTRPWNSWPDSQKKILSPSKKFQPTVAMHLVTTLRACTNTACLPLCSRWRCSSASAAYKAYLLLHVALPKFASSSRAAVGSWKGLLHQCHNRNVTDICTHEDTREKRVLTLITSQRHELPCCTRMQPPSHKVLHLAVGLLYRQRGFPFLLVFGV